MDENVAKQTVKRIIQHCHHHDKRNVVITFHGGEPMLGGLKHLEMLLTAIHDGFSDSGISYSLGMQSNGLLLSNEIGELMLKNKMTLGISLDGPPAINDIFRIDHQGNPSTTKLEERLSVLNSSHYRNIFDGFICVININTDPIKVAKYLFSFNPPSIHFTFPLNNYDNRPQGKEFNLESTPYADWLIKIFDYWVNNNTSSEIRIFNSIMRQMFGLPSADEAIGLSPIDLVIIETNGDIEAVDSLKSTYNGATCLGYNVFEHSFDVAAKDLAIKSRQIGKDALCDKCKDCPVVNICGGGYLPHRYSTENGFTNPSIYSSDLEKLIRHIHTYLQRIL
jgi:uncharacterized protein